jgi:hypothetical protein
VNVEFVIVGVLLQPQAYPQDTFTTSYIQPLRITPEMKQALPQQILLENALQQGYGVSVDPSLRGTASNNMASSAHTSSGHLSSAYSPYSPALSLQPQQRQHHHHQQQQHQPMLQQQMSQPAPVSYYQNAASAMAGEHYPLHFTLPANLLYSAQLLQGQVVMPQGQGQPGVYPGQAVAQGQTHALFHQGHGQDLNPLQGQGQAVVLQGQGHPVVHQGQAGVEGQGQEVEAPNLQTGTPLSEVRQCVPTALPAQLSHVPHTSLAAHQQVSVTVMSHTCVKDVYFTFWDMHLVEGKKNAFRNFVTLQFTGYNCKSKI